MHAMKVYARVVCQLHVFLMSALDGSRMNDSELSKTFLAGVVG
jgi:hypothetical protein